MKWRSDIPQNLKEQIKLLEGQYSQQQLSLVLAQSDMNSYDNQVKPITNQFRHSILKAIDEWDAQNFVSNQSSNDKSVFPLLLALAQINFSQLRGLYLNNSHIVCVQPLSWMDTPKLQVISLYDNCITSLKPLIKFISLSLREITLVANQFNHSQISLIPKIYFTSKMSQFNISWKINSLHHKQFIDCFNQVAKLQAVYIRERMGISELVPRKLMKVLFQKFPIYGSIRNFYTNRSDDLYFVPPLPHKNDIDPFEWPC